MAEEGKILPLPEEDGTNISQPRNAYIPEEPTPDASVSLLDIQMPETPESNKGQTSDGDTSRLESPKMIKPVLGKVQAKKRLMAFANQFKTLPKSQVKSNLSQHSVKISKIKDKMIQDDTNKSRKKTEEKILAIEEIRREESKSKMLLAEAMAAANMEDENHINKNTSGILESTRRLKEKSRYKGINDSRKTRSTMDRKYSERYRHHDKTNRDCPKREIKERHGSPEFSIRKSSQDRQKRKKDKKKKDHRNKRDNNKTDENYDKKEGEKDNEVNEKEKQEEKREEIKNKKGNIKDRQNNTLEIEAEGKDKMEKDKEKWKEKELSKCNSWMELRKSGLTLDDIIHFRKRDNPEKSVRNRTSQDYVHCLEQMLMLKNYRPKRQALIAEGLDGPRKYPPESVKTTNRAKGPQLLYCENPRTSLLLNISQLLQSVTPERREKIRDICKASPSRFEIEHKEDIVFQQRNWYQQIKTTKCSKDIEQQITVQFPRSKWDSEDDETSSIVPKEKIENLVNQLHVSINEQEGCSTSSSIADENKIDNAAEDIKKKKESSENTIYNVTNDETSMSSLLQSTGSEKLVSEYEQFMKMVCTVTDVNEEYSPKKNLVKSVSPRSYHEFNIESNLTDNTNTEILLKGKFEHKEKSIEESIKSAECEESTPSTNCQIQIDENNIQIENINNNDESDDAKSIPSDWETVKVKNECLSDENTESKEKKKKKKQNKITSSSDLSSSNSSFNSEKEKKKKKHKRKVLSNFSSSDSDSTDSSSSSSSSESISSNERKKRKWKKKKTGKKRKKTRRAVRTKKKHKKKKSIDFSNSDSDQRAKKKMKNKKKTKETKQYDTKSINNGEINKVISKSPVITSHKTKTLYSVTPVKKIKEEAAIIEDKKRADQATLTRKNIITDVTIHDNECMKYREERKESKPNENFMEQWEVDSIIAIQQNDNTTLIQDHTEKLKKMDISEKDKYRKKRKRNHENVEQDRIKLSKINEKRNHDRKEKADEELEAKRKKRDETDVKNNTEFFPGWEKNSENVTQQIIENEGKFSKKLGKQKKGEWEETDFNTLNVPSLTQLEKEVSQKQLLADEWEVDSLEAIPDLIASKRKSNQNTSKKVEKEVKYDKKTDTYIAIEKESAKEMRKRQERLCAIRIWEEEQEEGEREEIMLLKQRNKRKRSDWDIEESFLCKSNEELDVCKINDIIGIEKDWNKSDENTNVKEGSNKLIKLETIGPKRVKKSRWDMGSQSEEKPDVKDIWEEDYTEWSKIDKCKQQLEETDKEESRVTDYSGSPAKSDLIDFYHRIPQNRESLERLWTSEEKANMLVQAKTIEDISVKNLSSGKTNEEQITSTNEYQTKDQFKEILNAKFKEESIELYSPSSPALSQKSQDVEVSSNGSFSNSLPPEKRRIDTLVTAEELSIPTAGITLQLTKLHDKHAVNEKIEDILDKVQLKEKDSTQEFDIDKANLSDDLPMNELCLERDNTGSVHMDIFAEYESEKLQNNKQHATSPNIVSLTMHTKTDEMDEGKTALKLIPKQLLIRRTNEQTKLKRILDTPLRDPAQHAAALLTIQKKLLESHALKDDIKKSPDKESTDQFKLIDLRYSTTNVDGTNKLLDTTEFAVAPKSSVMRQSKSPASEKAISVQPEQSENYDRKDKNDDVKKYKISRDSSDTNIPSDIRSSRNQQKRSPNKKENEKQYVHECNKDRKERKFDDIEKSDKESRNSKADIANTRKKSSPSARGRRRRSGSPYASWERQRSRSPVHSRSRSRSPKKKEEATFSARDRERKRERYDDERSSRSKTDERREKYARSPPRSNYNEDNFRKHDFVSSNGNRDDWDRRRRSSMDRNREKDIRLYDPIEMLRERTIESEKHRDNRFHTEELDRTFWQYENSNILRDGNESIDSCTAVRDVLPEYEDRLHYKEGSVEKDRICPLESLPKYRRRSSTRREQQWEKDKDSLGPERHGYFMPRLRNRMSPRSRHSPMRQTSDWFRRKSRSHSRSWSRSRSRTRSRSRSGSRSRSTSRSRPRIRSRSRSRSTSLSDSRIRVRSVSMSRLRSPEHGLRMSDLRSSRSPSPGISRLNEIRRESKDEDENRDFNVCSERGRRIETIVQSGITGTRILDPEMGISSCMDTANFQYSNEIESGNEYYYTENNLTYPPCIDESTTNSPKRLSLDDRLELELGIKKQRSKDSIGVSSEYSSNFNSNVIVYPSSSQQQQQIIYRQQPTVLQIGNVLQVVPADFNGVQSTSREVSAATTPPIRSGSSQVVRVGNVLQVVPTSLDWSSNQSSSTADQSNGVLHSSAPTSSPSASSASMSISVPVPVPLPVPSTVSTTANTFASMATMSSAASLSLPLPVPVPVPVPIPTTTTSFPRNEAQMQKIIQPVYNYEAILETRRKEQEERKRLRELHRKEKERRRIERINRRALRLFEKNNASQQAGNALLDRHKGSVVHPLVLKALKEGEEQTEFESVANPIKEEVAVSVKEEDEDAVMDEEEVDDEDEVEAEAEDDEEEEEEAEDEDEDDDDDEKLSQMFSQRAEIDEVTINFDANKDQTEIETKKEWPKLPPPPLKSILVASGFRRDATSNGNLDELSDADNDIKDDNGKDEEMDKNNEYDKDMGSDSKCKLKLDKLLKTKRNKKSVQFADGVKPGEGTSPSGGEGDMPSPPPPKGSSFHEEFKDLRRDKIYGFRKNKKQEKREKPPKPKKKVKVKIINKLKKPRVTPLTAMIMDDSDEADDRSPPPPPPGSPPPPHLWPSYLSIYNTTFRAIEQPQTMVSTLTSIQAAPPPTPLPLLVPPPPLNYTIQPCSKS